MVDISSVDNLREQSPTTIDELCERVQSYHSSADLDLLRRAYQFSEKAHSGQFRRSGEAYIFHPLGVAGILADLHLDLATIITGLLHDTVEDTTATLEDIQREFGETIANLVDGVTKISQMQFRNTHEKQGENIRKMIVAMGKDVRVILVKLADRLHNMRTLSHMPYEKQKRIAEETLDIYAPLASRLGISSIKVELEDLSFRFSQPGMYYDLAQRVAKKKKEREKYIEEVIRLIDQTLSEKTKIKYEIQGRPKHLYSIYRKMATKNLDYEEIFDVLAFRVIVSSVSECYEALGHIHSIFKPIPGRFKDYIAMPKVNNYQSLHTTVIGPGGERLEVQIRTQEMHLVAERGIAAHWKYKDSSAPPPTTDKIHWLRDLVAHHQQAGSSGEFLEDMKKDLFEKEIYVFTPTGEVKEFPEGATPIDFAYAIHTDVGHRCTGARINGRLVPLKTQLQSGDRVEIITNENQKPSKDWLKYTVTSRARSKIRWFVKNEERKRALEVGLQIMEKDFRKYGYSLSKFQKSSKYPDILKQFGANDSEDLAVRVGYGKLIVKDLIKAFDPKFGESPVAHEEETSPNYISRAFKSAIKRTKKTTSIIKVDGMDDVLVRFARCCNPIPGDPIVGFISLGRGISVHKADCERAFALDGDRAIDVAWSVDSVPMGVERTIRLRVICQDIPGLLKLMSDAFASLGMNINNAQIRTTKDKRAVCLFDVAVKDTKQLSLAMENLSKIKGVIGVTRVTQV